MIVFYKYAIDFIFPYNMFFHWSNFIKPWFESSINFMSLSRFVKVKNSNYVALDRFIKAFYIFALPTKFSIFTFNGEF